ncbi:MAG: endo alpha-1,4 polygalactosaminidase [Actinomycetota bacterium]
MSARRVVALGLAWLALVVVAPGAGARSSVQVAAPVACPGCWHPGLRVSWQWQLQAPPRASALLDVRMYDVDGFEARVSLVRAMHDQGTKAVCYLSAGSWEDWRPDAGDFPAAVLGRTNGWPGERWLDVRRLDLLRPIMRARVDMCVRKGFDGVEFDNVDGYQNRTGFPLTGADQIRYNVFLANQAHRRGLTAFLKNDLGQIGRLLPYFDAALNEQCHQYDECGRLDPFVQAGKPVFGVEYKLETSAFCAQANSHDFNFLRKRLSLDAWRVACRGV